jgi:hypothetical protein
MKTAPSREERRFQELPVHDIISNLIPDGKPIFPTTGFEQHLHNLSETDQKSHLRLRHYKGLLTVCESRLPFP